MSKGTTPLYLENVERINELLKQIALKVNLPEHKRSIDRSGRNVAWFRKAIGKWTVLCGREETIVNELRVLLEVA